MPPEVSKELLLRARQTGRYMREAHKPRSSVPLYEMGTAGHMQRKEWEAGWDQRDYEMKLGVAA
ncbi:hypothetical protein [Stenotrophomonas sp. CFBP 13718]|uniref:hypothetical protein n=1 Tax=Stenotrophomonas sp. CFBP 13718 TaxID=2775304 RepID=UPI0017857BB8|nr:hypothetical protein [Stenotrophomonas sp. CFBP 13718]MBD8696576.1 hypothetical protein [Stenotrophomonas sp. CFBP 13718]